MLAALIATPSAWAHPFGDKHTAQRIDATVYPRTLQLAVAVDVPDPLLPGLHGPRGEPDPDRLRELVVVSFDDRTLERRLLRGALRRAPDSDHTQVLEAIVEVDIPPTAGTLQISNGVLLGHPTWHSVRVRVATARPLLGGTHLTVRADGVLDTGPPWRMIEGKRDTRILLGAADPALALYAMFDGRGPLPAAAAMRVPLAQALAIGRTQPDTVGLGLGLASLLGALHGARLGRPLGASGLVMALMVPVLALLGASPAHALGALAVSLVLGAWHPPFRVVAPWAACLCLVTFPEGRWPWAFWIVWLALALATSRYRRSRPGG